MAETILKSNRLQNIIRHFRLFGRKENYTKSGLRTVTAALPSEVIKRDASNTCKSSCIPPKKKAQCNTAKKKLCRECPLSEDLPKPPCPKPERPPQPERCKEKFVIKKDKYCDPPCPRTQDSNGCEPKGCDQ